MWQVVRKALADSNEAYKKQADKKHEEPKPFKIGDRVYLSTYFLQRLQPSKKLGHKFVGPFPTKCIINAVTVELDLPKSLRQVHLVFHCTLLKSKVTSPIRPKLLPTPEPFMIEGEQHFEIWEILDFRKHRGTLQYLVA